MEAIGMDQPKYGQNEELWGQWTLYMYMGKNMKCKETIYKQISGTHAYLKASKINEMYNAMLIAKVDWIMV